MRLVLVCDKGTRLVWEDDAKRAGMKRRGPHAPEKMQSSSSQFTDISNGKCLPDDSNSGACGGFQPRGIEILRSEGSHAPVAMIKMQNIRSQNLLPTNLTDNESVLLDHYIQRFSRTYPTCSDSTNPFLSVLLPLAMQNRAVLDALLALSGAQIWKGRDSSLKETILRLRHRALLGCQKLLTQTGLMALMGAGMTDQDRLSAMSENEYFVPLACGILLLLYEKLVGYGKANWMPHLKFLAQLFDCLLKPANNGPLNLLLQKCRQHQDFQFLHSLFLYNDLVQSTAGGTSTLSDYYLRVQSNTCSVDNATLSTYGPSLPPTQSLKQSPYGRFYYPYLIAKVSTDQEILTDADIDAWDGRLDWLPSFSMTNTIHLSDASPSLQLLFQKDTLRGLDGHIDNEEGRVMSSVYRDTARIYMRQVDRQRNKAQNTNQMMSVASLACKAVRHVAQLREGSAWENALLWPIGIIAKELTKECKSEREYILDRLEGLATRFHMEHFRRMQEVLMATWDRNDLLFLDVEPEIEEDVFLFG